MKKVHITYNAENDKEMANHVLNILNAYPGPLEFVMDSQKGGMDLEAQDTIFFKSLEEYNKQDTSKIDELYFNQTAVHDMPMEKEVEVLTWSDMFRSCTLRRLLGQIPHNEPLILLTDAYNEQNWFGAPDPRGFRNVFIQTSGWDVFFNQPISPVYPVAYEVISWVLRFEMFSSPRDIIKHFHKKPRGCVNDFCEDKSEVILKMRTGDLCPDCLELVSESEMSPLEFRQIMETLDGLQKSIRYYARYPILQRPTALKVQEHLEFYFPELDHLKVHFTPIQRALFAMFLKHPEGFTLTEMSEQAEELMKWYRMARPSAGEDVIEKRIHALVKPGSNRLSECFSEIKRKLYLLLGADLSEAYIIKGEREEKRKIALDREFVAWDAGVE